MTIRMLILARTSLPRGVERAKRRRHRDSKPKAVLGLAALGAAEGGGRQGPGQLERDVGAEPTLPHCPHLFRVAARPADPRHILLNGNVSSLGLAFPSIQSASTPMVAASSLEVHRGHPFPWTSGGQRQGLRILEGMLRYFCSVSLHGVIPSEPRSIVYARFRISTIATISLFHVHNPPRNNWTCFRVCGR